MDAAGVDPGVDQSTSRPAASGGGSRAGSVVSVQSGVYSKVQDEAWVQCEHPRCLKWRRISKAEADRLGDDDHWFCSLNTDPLHNTCDAIEEDYRTADRIVKKCHMVYKFSTLEAGTLVWAKSIGFCRWPGIICPDPADNQSHVLSTDGEPLSYHVEYLGGKHSHNWVHMRFVELYGSKDGDDGGETATLGGGKHGKKRHATPWKNTNQRYQYKGMNVQDAIREAETWVDLSHKQRLDKVTFKYVPTAITPEIKKTQREGHRKRPPCSVLEKAKKFKVDQDLDIGYERPKVKKFKSQAKTPGGTTLLHKLKSQVGIREQQDVHKKRGRPFGAKTVNRKAEQKQKKKEKLDQMNATLECAIDEGDKFWSTFHEDNIDVDIEFDDELAAKVNTSASKGNKASHTNVQVLPVPTDSHMPGSLAAEVQQNSSFPQVKVNETSEAPHSMVNRSKEEKFTMDCETYVKKQETFDQDVRSFLKQHGVRLSKLPTWHNVPVTLYQIYLAVSDRGGYHMVCKKKQWSAVYRELSGHSLKCNGNLAKGFYEKYLLAYQMFLSKQEYKHLLNKKDEPKLKLPTSLKKEKKVQPKAVEKAKKVETTEKAKTADESAKEDESDNDSDDGSVCSNLDDIQNVLDDIKESSKEIDDVINNDESCDNKNLKLVFYDENTPDMNLSPKGKEADTGEFEAKPEKSQKNKKSKKFAIPSKKSSAFQAPSKTKKSGKAEDSKTNEEDFDKENVPSKNSSVKTSSTGEKLLKDMKEMKTEMDKMGDSLDIPDEYITEKNLSQDSFSVPNIDEMIGRLSQLSEQALGGNVCKEPSQKSEEPQKVPKKPSEDKPAKPKKNKKKAGKENKFSNPKKAKGTPKKKTEILSATHIVMEPIDPETLEPLGQKVTFDSETNEPMVENVGTIGPIPVKALGPKGSSSKGEKQGGSESDAFSFSQASSSERVFHEMKVMQQELDDMDF